MQIADILKGDNIKQKRALFAFEISDPAERIRIRFNLWSRHYFPKYFKSEDAVFHRDLDLGNIKAYVYNGDIGLDECVIDGNLVGDIDQFVDIAFRGAAKTARTKLFIAFAILNDLSHYRRFMRCISADLDNAKQSVTDIFNMLINPRIVESYPDTWQKNDTKREETMSSFTTSTGVKLIAKQIGVDQRGKIQEDAKADFDWYDDFETKTTLRSAVTTFKIAENMEEARTGLALNGGSIYTCNYISEAGNVHTLVKSKSSTKLVLIIPIEDKFGNPTWSRYSKSIIDKMRETDKDFEGERLCRPSASKDVYFDRISVDRMVAMDKPLREIAGFKMYKEYKPHHRYGSGHDVAGGVGLDSSTSVFIDFSTMPAQVVATFANNTVVPESFGDEIYSQGCRFGLPIQGIENNKYDQAVLKAKQLGCKLFKTRSKAINVGGTHTLTYGWNTNSLTKSQMLADFRTAIEDGLVELNDKDLIEEVKGYTRNDLIAIEPDVRMTTRHFDLLVAACVAWQMKDHAEAARARPDPDAGIWNTEQSKPRKNPAL